jgi:hypothetical protein
MAKPTGEQTIRITAKIREIERQLFHQKGGYPHHIPELLFALQMIVEGRFGDVRNKHLPQISRNDVIVQLEKGERLALGKTKKVEQKATKDCFSDETRYHERDDKLDLWLPEEQLFSGGGVEIWGYEFLKMASFLEVFVEMFALEKNDPTMSISRAIITDTHFRVWGLQDIEDLVHRQETGDDVGLLNDGRMNFFTVASELHARCTVYIVGICFDNGGWDVDILPLNHECRWPAGSRLFLPVV